MQTFPNGEDAENPQVDHPCVIKKKNPTVVEGWLPPSKTQVIVG